MSDLLSIGASGIKAYGSALGTVGDNIANSQTAGYVRRAIQTAEAPPGGEVLLYRNQINPGGTVVSGVTRSIDQWLVDDSRTAGAEAGLASAKLGWLEATERALGDGVGSVGAGMTAVFNSADRLASDPGNTTLRASFLQSVSDTAIAFKQTAQRLGETATGIANDAGATVNQLNASLVALERVNDGLRRARDGSTNQASLLDERDRLIDGISASLGVSVSFDGEGAATLRLPSGAPLVEAGSVTQLSVAALADGTLSFAAGASVFVPASGRLAGLGDAARTVTTQRASLDTLAMQFSADLNAAHQSGFDAQGNPGIALLTGSSAASLTAVALTADKVAAADGSSANGNILAMSGARGPGGGEAGWAALVAGQAQATASARAHDAASSTRRDGADAARSNISAVDLDREAADLLRYQQAYQAAARVIQVARETMQSILNAL